MAVQSKPIDPTLMSKILAFLTKSKKKKLLSFSIIVIFIYFLIDVLRKKKKSDPIKMGPQLEKAKNKGQVDLTFLKRLWHLIKIVIPSWKSPEIGYLVGLTGFLYLRTYLSIYLATVKGTIVKGIISLDLQLFLNGNLRLKKKNKRKFCCMPSCPMFFTGFYYFSLLY